MKNILVVSNEYYTPYFKYNTPTVNYYTKEWIKMGYNVKVIHIRTIYPLFFYWIASLFTPLVKMILGNYIETKRNYKDYEYKIDNTHIFSLPVFKLIPHGKYQKKSLDNLLDKILSINKLNNFIPDAVIGHFYNPQLELVSKLKYFYPQVRTSVVWHESPNLIKKTFAKNYLEYINNLDVIGFRSNKFKREFETIFGLKYKTYICPSGVPEEFVNSNYKKFKNKIWKFCFVGQLIPLKRVVDILDALHKAFPQKNFELVIAGEGFERENLEKKVKLLGIQSNVIFTGKKTRDEVNSIMNEADCFVMVSETEAFGLVYLEAMGKGCITIGTKGQGIDGVIVNGENGFLCEAKNSDDLAEIFKHIYSLPPDKLSDISKNALETAKNMTDHKVAEKYINTVMEL